MQFPSEKTFLKKANIMWKESKLPNVYGMKVNLLKVLWKEIYLAKFEHAKYSLEGK